MARGAFEARHGLTEFETLHRLHQEIAAAAAHAGKDGIAIGVEVGSDYVKIGRSLRYLFDRLERRFGIARKIGNESGFGVAFEILQHADIKVRCNLGIFGDDFGAIDVDEAVADGFAEAFIGGRN